MNLRDVSLDDKFADPARPALMSGPQALVRLLITQRQRDLAAGLNTAGFVSGYRGSPLGYVDQAMWDAAKWLEENRIVFQPGINEDLAATAIWGTQQLTVAKDATVDGVFSLWYGKGPGVDRSGDPLKHGNYTGSHPNGGVLVLLGDDHPGKSSTIAHHSEQAMVAHQMPVVYPANVGELVRYGLLGWALSRYAGCWTAFKCVNESIEQTATVAGETGLQIATPPKGELPPEGLYYRGVYAPARDEMIHKRYRLPLVQKFWRANRVDRSEFGVAAPRLGIVTAGKAYGDVMQALRHLGIDAGRARALGVDVYKVGLIWPLEPEGLREFCASSAELFFVEEKSAFMEPQAAALLYNDERRPRIVGKRDEQGETLLPSDVQLDWLEVALAIARRLERNGLADAAVKEHIAQAQALCRSNLSVTDVTPKRLPFFCSGCPHNTSTNVPEGSIATAGIGCHGMAMWAKPGTTLLGTQMGGEGATWAALQHFTSRKHMFQNLGDGTYYHSGLLAIRQAIAAKANITYKILFNDAIAMTGGQPVEGPLSPVLIAQQVLAEGARKAVLVTEDPSRYAQGALPAGVPVRHRSELDEVQRELREEPGCTVIIYEQTCAAEKRRRRKRKALPDPPVRMVINDAVCEGCGDCSAKSGCVSIEPLETPLGRKRRINQSSCNKDYSCAKGFCPSFVTLEGVEMRRRGKARIDEALFASLPPPQVPPVPPIGAGIMLAGIGGTGVVTVGAVLAMAAHLQGLQASVYDMTGMSQKNGAVLSHLRLTSGNAPISTQVVGVGEAQLVIAFDLVAALSDEAYRTLSAETRFLGNNRVQITSAFNFNPDEKIDTGFITRKIESRVASGNTAYADATGIALTLCGDAIGANFFMVGAALQKGWLPLSMEAVERAVQLNGVQVAFNLEAIRLGRLWAHDCSAVDTLLRENGFVPVVPVALSLDELVADRAKRLTDYQNEAYAQRFRRTIAKVREAESRAVPGQTALTETAVRALHKLMAYKDEYEVARLHTDPAFLKSIEVQFEGTPTMKFHMAPPLFAKRDPRTGHLMKQQFGPWVFTAFKVLAKFRFLRGTALDIFGRSAERQMERRLIADYESLLDRIAGKLDARNHAAAVELAGIPQTIRGFGHVKEASVAKATETRQRLLTAFESPAAETTEGAARATA
ncbi:MAG: indolepyruvate ferredoxin oxidoreductase family protein [Betaproteobacteria bacterium]|nr:indolepyruvate ferredoxin oxidoreductase family protein [Betaproteobacteria bacterium]